MQERYVHFNSWLKRKFGERTLKICVDGGFSCPNRDGKCGHGGCIFCGERGSGENTKPLGIKEQVLNYLNSYKGQRANKFIVYFQNFTNTYAPVETLKEKYNQSLCDPRIIGLNVATRPDCINAEVVELLKSYTQKYYVLVELGFQTSNEETAKLINRGYNNNSFVEAVKMLKNAGIDVVVHVMVGLPNETREDVLNSIKFVNHQNIMGLKIHSTYVLKNTKLEDMYLRGQYTPITQEFYVDVVADIIKNLNKNTVVCRISGDPPKSKVIAPLWQTHKKLVINAINKKLQEDDIYQGNNLIS